MNSVYENIATKFNDRYSGDDFAHISRILAQFKNKEKILEIGCGTFYWNSVFNFRAFGVDISKKMLLQSEVKNRVAVATAEALPFAKNTFDFIYVINAFHQFKNKRKVAKEIFSALKENGEALIVTADFHGAEFKWYLYDYFPQTKEFDEKRFLSAGEYTSLFRGENFGSVEIKNFHTVNKNYYGEEVFSDKFLRKHNSSQLALLSEKEYSEGISKIKDAIAQNAQTEFVVRIPQIYILVRK